MVAAAYVPRVFANLGTKSQMHRIRLQVNPELSRVIFRRPFDHFRSAAQTCRFQTLVISDKAKGQ